MHKNISGVVIAIAILLCTAFQTHAAYFTIQLQNGREIDVGKYWDEGKSIRFYRDGGSIAIPKESIIKILKKEGALQKEVTEPISITDTPAEPEGNQKNGQAQPPGVKPGQDQQTEIREKIDIIETNISTLNEKKNYYVKQKNSSQEVKGKAAERIEKYRTSPYTASKDLKEITASEDRKIQDAEDRIRDADEQITAIEGRIENQERIKRGLQSRQQ
ncbi:MAG: hypothetical protein NTZ51_08705 [Proteobacteria bacterium]|nr:hypothetical protein [Pseudomonadota bacterium]